MAYYRWVSEYHYFLHKISVKTKLLYDKLKEPLGIFINNIILAL